MEYAKFQEVPLPTGSAYLRVNHIEVNYPFGATPTMTVSMEKRTVLSDGSSFGEQLDSVQIPLEGKAAQFDVLNRATGEIRKDAVSLKIDDLSDVLFSVGQFSMQAREVALEAQKAAQEAQALADAIRDDPFGGFGVATIWEGPYRADDSFGGHDV